MKFNISFKKEPRETGLASIGSPYPATQIKVNKKVCGSIRPPNWQSKDNNWKVSITVIKDQPDDNPNCDWKWITFKARFTEEKKAREFIKKALPRYSDKLKYRG